MTYSFSLLSGKEDCDAMISITSKNKAVLEYKKITLLHKKEISTGNAVG